MGEITAITPQVKDKNRCNVFVDGRFYCGLTIETAVKSRLKVGQTVTEEFLSQLQLESEKNVALDKALTHVSATQKTEKQVRDFLAKKGYLSAVIEYVVEKMRSYRFLDDASYAENYVRGAGKKKGGRLIKMELRAKGVSDEDAERAVEGITEEEQLQTARAIAEKYMRGKTPDTETLQKAYRRLLSRGFDYETAKSALSAYRETGD